jgi:hypothetical protein
MLYMQHYTPYFKAKSIGFSTGPMQLPGSTQTPEGGIPLLVKREVFEIVNRLNTVVFIK